MKTACFWTAAFFASHLPIGVSYCDEYEIQWVDTVDNGDWDGASCIAVDDEDNIIVAGCSFLDGDNDYFLVKYDSGGTILWQDTIDNGAEDLAEDVAVDHSGNIVLTGYSMIGGDYDYFTVKYDPEGAVLWKDTLDNGGLYDIARGTAVDDSGNVIVTGYCDIGHDCVYFTVKYDPDGAIIWTDTLDYGPHDSALDVAVDHSGEVSVTGYTSDGTNNDYLTVKYDSSGSILWQDALDIYQFDQAYGVAVDDSKSILVTGCTRGSFEDNDCFTVRYEPGGVIAWSDTLDNGNCDDVAYDVATDNSGNAYVAGYTLELAGDYDYYAVKYSPAGAILWHDILDNGDNDIAYGIAVDAEGSVIVTGRSYVTGDYDFYTVKYVPVQGVAREESEAGPDGLRCSIFPNPFTEGTGVEFLFATNAEELLASHGPLAVHIYSPLGRLVKSYDRSIEDFPFSVTWGGRDYLGNVLASGVYLLVFEMEEHRGTGKLLLVR
jgi:uncharacterized delta-60 repeat protein